MTSLIYSPIKISCIDSLPIDIQYVIGDILGYKHHVHIYINLIHGNKVSDDVKKFIYYDCFPYYNMYNHALDFNVLFEKYVIKHIHNIVETYKVIPLFYTLSNYKKYVTCEENMRLFHILSHGYDMPDSDTEDAVNENITVYTTYRLCKKPLIYELTKSQCLTAFLAHNFGHYSMYDTEKMEVHIKCKYFTPSENDVFEYLLMR